MSSAGPSSSSASASPRLQQKPLSAVNYAPSPSASPEWPRSHLPVPGPSYSYGGSSADAYAIRHDLHTDESNLLPGSFFRPETAMSAWSQDDPAQQQRAASSFETHNTTGSSSNPNGNGANGYKRGSVLSFQTALSGGMDNQRSQDGLRDIARQQQQAAQGSASATAPISRRPDSTAWSNAPNNRTYPPQPMAGVDVDQFGQMQARRFSSQPSSAQQSPAMVSNKSLPPLARPSSPMANHSRRSSAMGPLAATEHEASSGPEQEPSGPVTLDRNRTVRPTHGRGSSNQASLDLKSQPPLPTNTTSLDSQTKPIPTYQNDEIKQSPSSNESAPPLPIKDMTQKVGQASLSARDSSADSIIPPPLPAEAASSALSYPNISIGGQSPVSDLRKKPLVDVTPAMQAAGRASLQQRAGVGAHDVSKPILSNPPSPEDLAPTNPLRPRTGSNAGLIPRAMMVEAPSQPPQDAEPVGRASFSSAETPSREPSPPPEGEVEARAEWERARMKQKQKQKKPVPQDGSAYNMAGSAAAAAAARKTTLRGQLKPLQLVAADDAMPLPELPQEGLHSASPTTPMSSSRLNGGAAMSTQQLQKQQARDQRRSVGQINLAMGMAGGEMSSGANGPYPVFPSPSTGAVAGGRQYSGMIPQRSLVPPFELQHRPDGLLSGLIGPDGVRRSVNDPEVCIECMMRDEDMIDVHVVGAGLWERESDRDFEDALRVESEDDARRERERSASAIGGVGGTEDQSIGGHSSSHAASREGSIVPPRSSPAHTKVRVKRVGKHDPLTADRLKLHTQMNPPASSHRWRTLQNFLAVQARYIAMEQRARHEEWERTHPAEAAAARAAAAAAQGTSKSRPAAPGIVNGVSIDSDHTRSASPAQDTFAPIAARKSVSKNRSASAMGLKSHAKLVGDDDLAPSDKALRDRDVMLAREARRKNAAGGAASTTSSGPMSVPGSALMSNSASNPIMGAKQSQPKVGGSMNASAALADEERRKMTSTPISVSGATGSLAPRRPHLGGLSTPVRGASASDLRSVSGAMLSSPTVPSTPDSLAPPSALAGPGSMLSTPRGFGGRTASQLSLAPSGSMMDMHVALAGASNQADHRAGHGQTLPLPSPIDLDRSGSASQQAFHGFPGDGDVSAADPAQAYRSDFQNDCLIDAMPNSAVSKASGQSQPISGGSTGKKKKGLRGFFSKLSGSAGANNESPHMNSGNGDAFMDDGETSKRSETGSVPPRSPRNRRQSMSGDSSLAPPPGIAGLLSRARRSTSSLLGGRESVDTPRELYNEPPGMMSPDRFDMGPFQPPLPPERKQSRVPGENQVANQQGQYFPSRQQSASPTSRRPQPSRLSMQVNQPGQGGQRPPFAQASSTSSKTAVPFAQGAPSGMQTLNSSSHLSQGRTNTTRSSSNFTDTNTSPATSQTASMLSSQSKTGGVGAIANNGALPLPVGHGGPLPRAGASASSKLPTIESSPGVHPVALDGAGAQQQPRQSMNLVAGPPLRPVRSPRRPAEGGLRGEGESERGYAGNDMAAMNGRRSMAVGEGAMDEMRRQRSASALGMQSFPVGGGGTPAPNDRTSGYSYPGLGRQMPGRAGSTFSASSTQEDFLQQQQQQPDTSYGTKGSSGSGSRKSRLLRLPFGFNKSKSRSSMLSNDMVTGSDASAPPANSKPASLRSRASANALQGGGTMGMMDDESIDEKSRKRASSKPRKSINLFDRSERPRAFSSGSAMMDNGMPPRAQSVLGNMPPPFQQQEFPDHHPTQQQLRNISSPQSMRRVSEEPW